MNYLLVQSYNGDIVLSGSLGFINEYRQDFPGPDYIMMAEEEYDMFLESRLNAFEAEYC
jgi:hypothetical protein